MDETDAFMATQVVDDEEDAEEQIVNEDDEQSTTSKRKRLKATKHAGSTTKSKDASKWGADPLFWTHLCLLNVHVTKGLVPCGETWDEVNRERKRLGFNHALPKHNRVVSNCHVMGTLVRFHRTSLFTTFTLDDGTALLDCVEWNDDQQHDAFVRKDYILGATLRCFGKLDWPQIKFQSPFRQSVRRVLLSRPPVVVRNVQEELYHWKNAMELWEGRYSELGPMLASTLPSKPYALSKEQQLSYGGEVEDAIMTVLKTTNKMPLLTTKNEPLVRERFATFFKICFEQSCLIREEPVASLLAVKSAGNAHKAESFIADAIRRLIFRGHVIVMDSKMDLLAILTHEDFLAPALLRVIAKTAGKEGFVEYKTILQRTKEDARLHCVSEDRVKASLLRLADESVIFEGTLGCFALFNPLPNPPPT